MNLLIPFFQVIDIVLSLFYWAIIIYVVVSLLVSFNVVNPHNQFVRWIMRALGQIVEPALRPIRRVIPIMGGLDLSPLVLIIGIFFVRQMLFQIMVSLQ